MKLVKPAFLKKKCKEAIVVILIFGAIIKSPADPLSQMLIALPLYLLYEISIIISERVMMRKLREARTGLTAVAVSSLLDKTKRNNN